VAQRGAHVGIAQHAGELAGAGRAGHELHVARGEAARRALRHDEVVIRTDRDLGKMGDHEHLPRARRAAGHARQSFAHASPD